MTSPPASGIAVLQRLLKPRPKPAGESCEMCGEQVPSEHSHVVRLDKRQLMCTCRGCALLFTNAGAGQGRYRAVPTRVVSDPDFRFDLARWDQLAIPVGLAFLFTNSTMGQTVAFYPSPAGATESELNSDSWSEISADTPLLDELEPDVEALLLRRTDDGVVCYLVPIDICYELVGLVRTYWRGFAGGDEVWAAVDELFERVRVRSRPYPRG
ncbi:MAG: DUF5947 family protein [Actinomycetota bacterium]|nr:DUF5947 family protein [Actinomycetota bacterium]